MARTGGRWRKQAVAPIASLAWPDKCGAITSVEDLSIHIGGTSSRDASGLTVNPRRPGTDSENSSRHFPSGGGRPIVQIEEREVWSSEGQDQMRQSRGEWNVLVLAMCSGKLCAIASGE